jgi:predicted DNA-binding transcriptional regulator YafY
MYHPTTRVLTVLELLQARHRMTGAELAARLEVDTRTVRRYVVMLQELGIPVQSERGRYGAYRLLPGFKLPPLMFTDDEALALTLGLLAARRLGMAAAAPAVEGALAKIERVLPAAVRARVQAVQQALVIDAPPPQDAPDQQVIVAFSIAAQQNRCLAIRYRAPHAEETTRVIEPYGLVYRTGRWYAPAYCQLRRDLRVFRLDRVREVTPCEEAFTRPPDFDCLAYVTTTFATMPGAWHAEVLLRVPLEHARRLIPADLATLEETPDGTLMHCWAEDLDWIARFLVRLGCRFTVREPAALNDTLRRLADEIARAVADAAE